MPEQHGPENQRFDMNGPDSRGLDSKWPDSKWLEAIDACRPGSDDLQLAELGELSAELARNPRLAQSYDRVQKLDAKIAEAVADVPVPEGLQDRLLARLQTAAVSAAEPQSPAASTGNQAGSEDATIVPSSAVTPEKRAGRSLGGWITASGVLALAASVLLMVVFRPAPTEIGVDEIVQLALEDHPRIHSAADAAAPVAVEGTGDKAFPLSTAVRWRKEPLVVHAVHDFLGRSGVVYEITAPGGAPASLYVVDLKGPHNARVSDGSSLPSAPPARPPLDTGAGAVAAWQENGLLYVLVVEGGGAAYGQFIPRDGRFAARETSRPAWIAGNRAPIDRGGILGKVSLI